MARGDKLSFCWAMNKAIEVDGFIIKITLLKVMSLQKKQKLLVVSGFAESPGFKPLDF
jgi:hypothetical protein